MLDRTYQKYRSELEMPCRPQMFEPSVRKQFDDLLKKGCITRQIHEEVFACGKTMESKYSADRKRYTEELDRKFDMFKRDLFEEYKASLGNKQYQKAFEVASNHADSMEDITELFEDILTVIEAGRYLSW